MEGHQGFISLAICFLLYEKFLRNSGKIGNNENFSKGNYVFKARGKDLNISNDIAFELWNHFRNGILHRGMSKLSNNFTQCMTVNQIKPVVEKKYSHIYKFMDN